MTGIINQIIAKCFSQTLLVNAKISGVAKPYARALAQKSIISSQNNVFFFKKLYDENGLAMLVSCMQPPLTFHEVAARTRLWLCHCCQ